MKCIFIASIRARAEYKESYKRIISILRSDGNHVISDHVLTTSQEDLNKMTKANNTTFHKKILQNIKASDVVIAECSHQSLSVGYLLSYAVEQGKPTIVFYNSNSPEPNLFPTLSSSERLYYVKYSNLDELDKLVHEYAEYAKEQLDTRFNFFVSPSIERYLSWVAKRRKLPRSVFLRKLIEDSITKDKEYKLKE